MLVVDICSGAQKCHIVCMANMILCCWQVVFVHTPSRTLIATDLIWNYPGSGTPKGTQAWKFGMDRVYRPFYNNLMIKDKGQ